MLGECDGEIASPACCIQRGFFVADQHLEKMAHLFHVHFIRVVVRPLQALEQGFDAVELHTGRYCEARGEARARELQRLGEAAHAAQKLGLRVAAGHGLDYLNVGPVAALREVTELNIGYAIVCRAVLVGMERAVRDMKALMDAAK